MVLGLRTKSRKVGSVQIDYLVHVREISPWTSSQSPGSPQTVWLQWEASDQSSGSLASVVGDGKIVFDESFRLPVTLFREASRRTSKRDGFQKNCLEFYLYEPRNNKATKSQLLGSAVVNLADYGVIKEAVAVAVPVSLKRSSRNQVQSVLHVNIQPLDADTSSSSSKLSLSKDASLDMDGSESVPGSVNDEKDEDVQITSFTDDDDDDASSHSSRTVSSATLDPPRDLHSQNGKSSPNSLKKTIQGVEAPLTSRGEHANAASNLGVEASNHVNGSSLFLATVPVPLKVPVDDSGGHSNAASNLGIEASNHVNGSSSFVATVAVPLKVPVDDSGGSTPSSEAYEDTNLRNVKFKSFLINGKSDAEESLSGSMGDIHHKDGGNQEHSCDGPDGEVCYSEKHCCENESVQPPEATMRTKGNIGADILFDSHETTEVQNGFTNDKLYHQKSVQGSFDASKSNGSLKEGQFMEEAEKIYISKENLNTTTGEAKEEVEGKKNSSSCEKVRLESKVEMLEEELREAAAIEVSLYSVVAEHGSSANKVHAPARRLSRYYLHACKMGSQDKVASAARAAISGLILVSKACGNDVPRLTFWLSNSVVLRAIVSQAISEIEHPTVKEEQLLESSENCEDWEHRQTFLVALEKLEAWIFTRIIESVWWQTLTPHMQPSEAKGSRSKKASTRNFGLSDQDQGNFSIELWKKAFKDSCERLCPLRGGGHECGCLPLLAKLIMEPLVTRLDVAMFNAILRESADDIPTDPISDPISDAKVLPIPAGKSSFGAGVQLKNAIGSWSRWLTDLFGIDDNDCSEVGEAEDDKDASFEASSKAFYLLNGLSDLMMLQFDMLMDKSMRKEVCPKFGAPLISRVLGNFVPDEFNPNPIPELVFEMLAEDLESDEGYVTTFPCAATPTVYSPPSAASLVTAGIAAAGELRKQAVQRSTSSVLKKSYTSDDELDELDSPVTSILVENSKARNWLPKEGGGRRTVRYQLLREIWRAAE